MRMRINFKSQNLNLKIWIVILAVIVISAGCTKTKSWNRGLQNKVDGTNQAVTAIVPSPTPTVCEFTMAAVGDVMLGRSVMEQMEKRNEWTWPFAQTGERLAAADLTVGNLEAPLVTGCYQKENRYVLCSKPEAVAGLTAAGFDVLSLANNHTLNWGQAGYDETQAVLTAEGIETVDKDKQTIKEVCGLQVGFMGLDDVSKPLDLAVTREQVASLAAQVDIPVIVIHWGIEYVNQPVPRQREVAQVLSQAGAKVVVGAHPHWVQPAEYVGNTLVFWSLGNFVFDQMWSEETRSGEIAEVRFKTRLPDGQVQDLRLESLEYNLIPVRIFEYGQPRIEPQ